MKLLYTEVLCEKSENADLGIKSQNEWLKMTIDLDHVIAVKQNGFDEEDENFDKAVLYTNADYFVVNLPYEDALKQWK